MPSVGCRRSSLALVMGLAGAGGLAGQGGEVRVVFDPPSMVLDLKDSVALRAWAVDSTGSRLPNAVALFSSNRRAVSVGPDGVVRALRPGAYTIGALVTGIGIRAQMPITVRWPPVQTVEIEPKPDTVYQGMTLRFQARVIDRAGIERNNVTVRWSTDDATVLEVDRFGDVAAHAAGEATLLASGEGVTGSLRVRVAPSPVAALNIEASTEVGRTGDVIRFRGVAMTASGEPIEVPITWAVIAEVEDTVLAAGAAATVDAQGRFVAERAGRYTVVGTIGDRAASRTVAITHRHAPQRITSAAGQGRVGGTHTSDLWVWEGRDGRDYAVTGTWGGNGVAYFWDVTVPAAPALIDSIVVDARTVNDVKVDAERGLCVLTREGASNRRNGFVVVDCSDPRHVRILSQFDDGLLGGVHNVFLYDQHVFAINAGRRFDIISIADPTKPVRVGFFELDTPGHGIHDVWVEDGIAYTSNWTDGIVMVDVGNGLAGGSVTHPVLIGQYAYPIGATHAAFPYRSTSAGGRLYVFVGDEQFPYNLDDRGPDEAGGYVHVVDFTDPRTPREVARYLVPEAGPHNLWVENDTLYVAYYNAGLRVVDVSGELAGDLYRQGRELARFEAFDPKGYVPNVPMAWGPQPHKGHVFVSDFNSGLWAVRLPRPAAKLIP